MLGGTVHEREPHRYEITHVPAVIRNRDRQIGIGDPILPRYERDHLREASHQPCPANRWPSSSAPDIRSCDAMFDLIIERHRDLLKRGAVLVDEPTRRPARALSCAWSTPSRTPEPTAPATAASVSRQMQFVEIDPQGRCRPAGNAPYLDYRPLKEQEEAAARELLSQLGQTDIARAAILPLPRERAGVRGNRANLRKSVQPGSQKTSNKQPFPTLLPNSCPATSWKCATTATN